MGVGRQGVLPPPSCIPKLWPASLRTASLHAQYQASMGWALALDEVPLLDREAATKCQCRSASRAPNPGCPPVGSCDRLLLCVFCSGPFPVHVWWLFFPRSLLKEDHHVFCLGE